MIRARFPHRREQRKVEALERNEAWQKLSAAGRVQSLVERGHGHCEQAVRLRQEIADKLGASKVETVVDLDQALHALGLAHKETIILSEAQYKNVEHLLENPPKPNKKLKKLMRKKR